MRGDAMNVLVVVLEGARADHFGCYGYERETTPFLDGLARQGVRFVNASSTAANALPAIASLLTGLFPRAHGATEEHGALAAGPPTLTELLRGAGYRTAAFAAAPAFDAARGCGRGFERVESGQGGGRLGGRAADYARRASDRVLGRSDRGARRTAAALAAWAQATPEPFFALAHFGEAAASTAPPAPYDRNFADGVGDERCAWHDGALRYLDLRLQEVAAALAARWERTLVVITATHGAALRDDAPLLAPETLRVPLLLSAPGRIPRGFVVEEVAQLSDVAPTVLALVDVAAPDAPMQGRVLLRDGAATPGPDWAFAEQYRREPGEPRAKAVRGAREHFVWQSDEGNALYQLGDAAHVNQIGLRTARADALRRALFTWLSDTEHWMRVHGLETDAAPVPAAARRAAVE